MICIKSLNFFAISLSTNKSMYNDIQLCSIAFAKTYERPNLDHFHEIWNQGVP